MGQNGSITMRYLKIAAAGVLMLVSFPVFAVVDTFVYVIGD